MNTLSQQQHTSAIKKLEERLYFLKLARVFYITLLIVPPALWFFAGRQFRKQEQARNLSVSQLPADSNFTALYVNLTDGCLAPGHIDKPGKSRPARFFLFFFRSQSRADTYAAYTKRGFFTFCAATLQRATGEIR